MNTNTNTKPLFEKCHYQAVAELLNRIQFELSERNHLLLVEQFSETFAHDNPNFNAAKFFEACGVI